MEQKVIAHIYNGFETKFGVPRQSGLADAVESKIVFEPEYAVFEAVRGLEEFSHIWILWQFSEAVRDGWSPTVRPPRLGGNKRVGVFSTRSPFRPNSIGLSSVRLLRIENENGSPVLYVTGADMMNGTPIIDIKPYLAYTDSHPDAVGGFADRVMGHCLDVTIPGDIINRLGTEKEKELRQILSQDPRPSYQNDPERVYGFEYDGFEVKFSVIDNELTVLSVEKLND